MFSKRTPHLKATTTHGSRLDPTQRRRPGSVARRAIPTGSASGRRPRADRLPPERKILCDPTPHAMAEVLASTPRASILVVRLGVLGRRPSVDELGPGEWLVVPSPVRDDHRLPSRWPGRYLAIALEPEAGPVPSPDRPYRGDDPAIVAFAKAMVRMGTSPVGPSAAVCRAAQRTLQLRLAQVLAAPGDDRRGGLPPWQIQRIVAAVDACPAHPFSVARLAAMAGLSPFHFARAFAASVGLSPMAFVRVRRLALAETLLRQTTLDIDTVAEQVGYASAAALTRAFRKEYGLSPVQARRLAPTANV